MFSIAEKILSKRSTSSSLIPNETLLAGHLKAQKLTSECLLECANLMESGMTEREAAFEIEASLNKRGVTKLFHRPLAWFGSRSAFRYLKGYRNYLPSDKKLKEEDVFILDVAPMVEGFMADVGYTHSLVANPELDKAKSFLNELKLLIPQLFQSDRTTSQIWTEIDKKIQSRGYINCFAKYPFGVLGHRVYQQDGNRSNKLRIPIGSLSWFNWSTYQTLIKQGVFPELLNLNHRGSKLGLWAIEPHIGTSEFGAKFESILVVLEDKAYWLDADFLI